MSYAGQKSALLMEKILPLEVPNHTPATQMATEPASPGPSNNISITVTATRSSLGAWSSHNHNTVQKGQMGCLFCAVG